MLKEGGLSVLKLVAVCAVLIVLQNLVGIGLASVFNLGPLIGMATGSIPMVGGHGTAGSFGPLLEQMGAQGAATVAIAAATFGLVMGSVIGGPIARYLIDKDNLFCFECVQEPVHKTPVVGKEAYAVDKEYFLFGIGQLLVAMGIGSWITGLITSFGVTFPSYIGAMLAAAVIRNLSDLTGRYEVFFPKWSLLSRKRPSPPALLTPAPPRGIRGGSPDHVQHRSGSSGILHLHFRPVGAFYAEKNTLTRIRQKSSDLRRIVQTALEREIKKYDLQLAQMKDTEKREKYRIYGELLNTYGYSAKAR